MNETPLFPAEVKVEILNAQEQSLYVGDALLADVCGRNNAYRIARACNSHQKLLAACKLSEECFRELSALQILSELSRAVCVDNANLIRAAIREAEKE